MIRYKTQKFRSSVVLTFNEIDIYSCGFFLFKEWVEVRNLLSFTRQVVSLVEKSEVIRF